MRFKPFASVMVVAVVSAVLFQTLRSKPPKSQAFEFPRELLSAPRSGVGAAHSKNFLQSYRYNPGMRSVLSLWQERDPLDAMKWHTSEVLETTSFNLTAVAHARSGQVLYVAGIDDDGVETIERWTYDVRPGGYGMRVAESSTARPLGVALPAYEVEEFLNGAEFVAPIDSQHSPAHRECVYRGTELGLVRTMTCDPEGRFLIALSYPDQSVYQLDLVSGAPPVKLLDPSTFPRLASINGVALASHAVEGRKLIFSEWLTSCVMAEDHHWSLMSDADNDGLFDAPVTLTAQEWASSRYAYNDQPNWREFDTLITFSGR